MENKQNSQGGEKSVKKITLGFILSWALGALSVVSGAIYLFKQPLVGLLYLVLAFVLLPPANELVKKRFNFAMSGGLKFVLVIVLLIITGAIMKIRPAITVPGMSEPTTSSSVSETAEWYLVKSWSGTSAKKTEPFTITGKQWRIIWSNKDTTGFDGTIFQVYVYKPSGSFPTDVAVNAQAGSDVSYIYKSGEFYLDINAANGSWTLKVEELR